MTTTNLYQIKLFDEFYSDQWQDCGEQRSWKDAKAYLWDYIKMNRCGWRRGQSFTKGVAIFDIEGNFIVGQTTEDLQDLKFSDITKKNLDIPGK